MSQNEHTASSAHNVISPNSSWLTRRIGAILVGIWFGGILMVALSAPAAFQSVDAVLASPTAAVTKMQETLGPTVTREVLRYQVGEANRLMFEAWGIAQLVLGALLFVVLLFLSTVRRASLGLSLAMLVMAGFMQLVLIPRMGEVSREMRSGGQAGSAELMDQFKMMHLGFTAFELAVVALGSILLVLLLRARSGGGSGSSHRRRISD